MDNTVPDLPDHAESVIAAALAATHGYYPREQVAAVRDALREAGWVVVRAEDARLQPTCGDVNHGLHPVPCLLTPNHEGWHLGLGASWSTS